MASITLSDIRAAADKKYAHTVIDLENGKSVTLLNPLRMSATARKALTGMSDALKEEGADQFEVVANALVAAAETPAQGKALVKELNGDLGEAMATFEFYNQGAEVGEA